MEIHTFYIVRWRKIFMGIILIFTSFIPYLSLYIALLKEESFFSIIASFGVANIPFIILMISGIYFIIKRKIPLIRFDKNRFYYNDFILKENYRDGIFFIFFPYCYYKLNTFYKYYAEIETIEDKSRGVFIKKKKTSFFSRNPIILQMGSFSIEDKEKIIKLLNQHIQ